MNIHILQCGARVEEDAKIRDQDEFNAYMQHMVLRGFGGTDFRPVFEHVDALIKQHEFANLKGLIYSPTATVPSRPCRRSMRRLSCSWTRDGNCPTCRPGR